MDYLCTTLCPAYGIVLVAPDTNTTDPWEDNCPAAASDLPTNGFAAYASQKEVKAAVEAMKIPAGSVLAARSDPLYLHPVSGWFTTLKALMRLVERVVDI